MGKPKMILVVDDDPNLLMFFSEYFKQEGFNAMLSEDPEKAVRMANVVHPDLLIMDIRMPKVDGFGVLNKVRERTPDIKTIIVSSYTADVEDKIKAANVQAVLKKPVRFEDLEKWVLKLLAVTKAEVQEKNSSEGRPKLQILFVDDEKEILDDMASILSEYGYGVDTAKSGEEGLEKMRAKQYDILITDHSMGNLSGYDMVQKMTAEARFKPYVMAVCSAAVIKDFESKYRALGITEFIQKPIRFEEMMKWLEAQIPVILKKRQPS